MFFSEPTCFFPLQNPGAGPVGAAYLIIITDNMVPPSCQESPKSTTNPNCKFYASCPLRRDIEASAAGGTGSSIFVFPNARDTKKSWIIPRPNFFRSHILPKRYRNSSLRCFFWTSRWMFACRAWMRSTRSIAGRRRAGKNFSFAGVMGGVGWQGSRL